MEAVVPRTRRPATRLTARQGSHRPAPQAQQPEVVLPSSAAIAREELLFAFLGLGLKAVGLTLAFVTLAKLALAHQQRLDRHSEIQAVLSLQLDRLEGQSAPSIVCSASMASKPCCSKSSNGSPPTAAALFGFRLKPLPLPKHLFHDQ